MAKIRHIAIFSDDPERLSKFYVDVFGMEVKGTSKNNGAVWMTDGYMDIALLLRRSELAPEGVHHFGITVDPEERAGVFERLAEQDACIMTPPPGRPYVEDAVKDADGNKFDISTSMTVANDGTMIMKDGVEPNVEVKELEKV